MKKYIIFGMIACAFIACKEDEIRVSNLLDNAKLHGAFTGTQADLKALEDKILASANVLKTKCNTQDDAKACAELAGMLFEGYDLEKNVDLAMQYYDKSCKLKDVNACENLVSLYKNGYSFKDQEVLKDELKAKAYERIIEELLKEGTK